jgi:thiazole synthase
MRDDATPAQNGLTLAGTTYQSRLLVGTGKYRDFEETRLAIEESGAEIVTVTIRRVNIGQERASRICSTSSRRRNTRSCPTRAAATTRDAVYTLQLARELLGGHQLCKLEVLGDEKTLFPNMPETLKAAEQLVRDGFQVMVYCSDDPIQARMLEDIGCIAVMPLAP